MFADENSYVMCTMEIIKLLYSPQIHIQTGKQYKGIPTYTHAQKVRK